MRRALVPGALLLLAGAVYVFRPKPAHISALVPEDFQFGVFTSSLDDLRRLYEAPYAPRDADPAHLRFGLPCNVPGLDGFSYDEPAGSFLTASGDEIFLVPVRDVRAFESAFERERESLRMRPPRRPAKNYLSLSEQAVAARRGPRNDLVLEAVKHPLALCGHPRDGATLRLMLAYLLLREAPRKPTGVPLLAHDIARIPAGVTNAVARECEDLLLAFPLPTSPDAPVRAVAEAALAPQGTVARSAHLVTEVDLTDVAASFPSNTVLLLGMVLDARAWQELGVPLPLGDAAFACGLVEERIHARRFTALFAARPRSPHDLARLQANGAAALVGGVEGLAWTEVDDQTAVVRTAALRAPPSWLADVLRSDAEAAPPVYASTTVERGIWYCAIGSQAEGTVRRALGCLRDTPQLGLSSVTPVAQHPEFLARPHVGLALVTASGLRAFDFVVPYFEIASIAQPPSITAVLDVDDRAKLDVRIVR